MPGRETEFGQAGVGPPACHFRQVLFPGARLTRRRCSMLAYGVKFWIMTSWFAGVMPGLPRKSVQAACATPSLPSAISE